MGCSPETAAHGFEFLGAPVKFADIKGMNNAFWLTTSDHSEIDVGEDTFPNDRHLRPHAGPVTSGGRIGGLGSRFRASHPEGHGMVVRPLRIARL